MAKTTSAGPDPQAHAKAFAPFAKVEWKQAKAKIDGETQHVLIINWFKTDKAKQGDLLGTFQLESLEGHAARSKSGSPVWKHPTRVPLGLASNDPDPFAVADRDISSAYGPCTLFLMLDVETNEVYGVDISNGYVAEEGAEAKLLAKSAAELRIEA